ncbi:aminodeoxychorismate synthase component I [Paenibacillus sp. MMS18-CY102]|nr:aminodeoxychorismate synthase component I [Paenibacillus sp. MMS18-CY102]
MKTLIIDNYDSYTYNIFQLVAKISGQEPIVIRNDQMSFASLQRFDFDNIIISPGPGRPEIPIDVGLSAEVLLHMEVPILGVCLGHQTLAYVCGGEVMHAPEIFHGRLSEVFHDELGLFTNIPQGFKVVRYHSLIVNDGLPASLEKTAWTSDGVIMGLRHREKPQWSVQFHPESICTEYGEQLFQNFHDLTIKYYTDKQMIDRLEKEQETAASRENSDGDTDSSGKYEVIVRELPAYYDPEEVFVQQMADQPYAFWLDSSKIEPGRSRYSFIGANTGPFRKVIRYRTADQQLEVTTSEGTKQWTASIFDYLEHELKAFRCDQKLPFDFNGGFVGFFGYELKEECGGNRVHASDIHDAMFIFADQFVAFDHELRKTYLVSLTDDVTRAVAHTWLDEFERHLQNLSASKEYSPQYVNQTVEFQLSRSYKEYIQDLNQLKQYLVEGESYEVNLTNRIHTGPIKDTLHTYRVLRKVNPAPYSAYLRFDQVAILCSSPEKFIQVSSDRSVEAKPIKGTLPRGKSPDEDQTLKQQLLTSVKDFSENLMIVDLIRNDLGVVCEVGSVHVPKLMEVESFETVHQLVSTIKGKLKQEVSVVECIKAGFPAGSMTGAPKIRTMEIIDTLEKEPRGVYSGTLGLLSLNGSADLNVVIRTIVCTPEKTTIGVGGGITIQSNADSEYEEMLLKAKALMNAIVVALNGEKRVVNYVIHGARELVSFLH